MDRSPGQGQLELTLLWHAVGGVLLGGVTILSLLPLPDTGVSDKFSHVLTYAVLSAWFSLLSGNYARLGVSVAGLFCFGVVIEWLQGMTGYRHAEWGDVLANGLGILAGSLVYATPLPRALRLVDAGLARLLKR